MASFDDIDLEELNARVDQKVEKNLAVVQVVLFLVSLVSALIFGGLALVIPDAGIPFLFTTIAMVLSFQFGSLMVNTSAAKRSYRAQILTQELGTHIENLLRDSKGKRKRTSTRLEDVIEEDGEIIIAEDGEIHTQKRVK